MPTRAYCAAAVRAEPSRLRACAEAVPKAFGLSRSSPFRRYIQATTRNLQALQERRLDGYNVVALVLDGKAFADDTLVTALGLTPHGDKLLPRFVQTGTENATACADFLHQLVARGPRYEDGHLVVIDVSKGLRVAVEQVFGPETPVQRCVYHRRENVTAYLPKSHQSCGAASSSMRMHSRPTRGRRLVRCAARGAPATQRIGPAESR